MVKVIADIGSTHGNDRKYLAHTIDVAAKCGIDIKCQLFGPEIAQGGNVMLSHDLFAWAHDRAAELGVEFFASVWREEDYALVKRVGCGAIKFAHSQRNSPMIEKALREFSTVYISGQHLDVYPGSLLGSLSVVRLLCIPQYPVYDLLSFEGCFPPFDGFSDHTLGIQQSFDAVEEGARVLEKHVAFDGYHDCPDARFAIRERDLTELIGYLHGK